MLVDEIRKIQKTTQPERDAIIADQTAQLFKEIKAELIQAAKNPVHTTNNLTIKTNRYPWECWKNLAAILRGEGFMVTFHEFNSYMNIFW